VTKREQAFWRKAVAFCVRCCSGEDAAREARLGNPWPLLGRFRNGERLTRGERRFIEGRLRESCGRRGKELERNMNGILARLDVAMLAEEGKLQKVTVAQLQAKFGVSRRTLYYRLKRARFE
jgi:hypothetical protein